MLIVIYYIVVGGNYILLDLLTIKNLFRYFTRNNINTLLKLYITMLRQN